MKKIIILIVLLLVGCTGKTTTAFPYYEKMQEISPVVEIELSDEKIAIYHSQNVEVYYIYELSNDDNCVIATRTKIYIGGNKNGIYRIGF